MIVVESVYQPRGAARELFLCLDPEVVLEGPANTGKTRAAMELAHFICEEWPGCRILFTRKTRVSMSESVLRTFEDLVVPPGHPCLSGPSRAQRKFYEYPNGSRIVCVGMDNPSDPSRPHAAIMSTEFDIAFLFEATEFSLDDYEKINTRCRNKAIPHPSGPYPDGRPRFFNQVIAECNPDDPFHWINLRAEAGIMRRLLSRHEDNPTVTPDDIARLDRLTGARKLRLRHGMWAAAEGQIYDMWDAKVHIIDEVPIGADGKSVIRYYLGGIDWGLRAPGCLQIWGVDGDGRIYRVAEVYHTEWTIGDEWDREIRALDAEFNPRLWLADPEEAQAIKTLRRRGINVKPADNDWTTGRDLVIERLRIQKDGRPRLFLLKNALRHRDESLVDASKPWCTEMEIPSYCYPKGVDGKPIKETPDPGRADHGCDTMRYVVKHLDGRSYLDREKKTKHAHGTYGHELGHDLEGQEDAQCSA